MMAAFGQVNAGRPAVLFSKSPSSYLPFVALPAVHRVRMLVLLIVAVLAKPWAKKRAVVAAGAVLPIAGDDLPRSARPNANDVAERHRRSVIFNNLLRPYALQPQPLSAQRVDGARRSFSWSGGLFREGGFFFLPAAEQRAFRAAARLPRWRAGFFYDSWARAFSHRSERSQLKADTPPPGAVCAAAGWKRLLDSPPARRAGSAGRCARWCSRIRASSGATRPQWTQVMIFFGLC